MSIGEWSWFTIWYECSPGQSGWRLWDPNTVFGASIHHVFECGCMFVAVRFVSAVGDQVIAGAVRPAVGVISYDCSGVFPFLDILIHCNCRSHLWGCFMVCYRVGGWCLGEISILAWWLCWWETEDQGWRLGAGVLQYFLRTLWWCAGLLHRQLLGIMLLCWPVGAW